MKTYPGNAADGDDGDGVGGNGDDAVTDAPALGDFLDDARVVIDLDVGSRKRLLEQLAKLICGDGDDGDADDAHPDLDTVLHALTKREKLGCTGIGGGVALPHGRIDGLSSPLMAVARLKTALNYDAPDGAPVWLAVCLLAPTDADATHLQLLAALASRFNTPGYAERLKNADSAAELAALIKYPA